MRFAPERALLALDDRAMWDTVDEHADGSVVVTFALSSLEGAARLVLSYGPHTVVLEPEELRRLVSEQSQAVAALYNKSKEG
jgi:predicted DNA-binding transcriptional regulator YafY